VLLAAALAALTVVASSCAPPPSNQPVDNPGALAFDDGGPDDRSTITAPPTTVATTTTTTAPPPVELGDPTEPFKPLPTSLTARAVQTQSGVVLPVLGRRDQRWMVMTACENIEYVDHDTVTPIGRAHVVLDPGHGGTEIGAVGPEGTTEKNLNLSVALEAQQMLEANGATVIVTRQSDHNVTTGVRGLLAKSIDPALFVSIHHNGGAPRRGQQPGTIVFTKGHNDGSDRFGGLFHQALNRVVQDAADLKRQAHAAFAAAADGYEVEVAAYDQSVQARDAALVANGHIPASATTTVPARPEPVDGMVGLSGRNPQVTTTVPASATETVPVPETLPVPITPDIEPVRQFVFAGGPNGGVRSWTRADGKDFLSVLRHSGEVPAVLAEFLYVTNPSEEELLRDPAFVTAEAQALTDAVVEYFSTDNQGTGFVEDQHDDQPIGGGGKPADCVEPD